MKKAALHATTVLALVALSAPAFGRGGNHGSGRGNGNCSNCSKQHQVNPKCDGTGMRHRQRDGSGTRHNVNVGTTTAPQTTPTATETTPATP